MSVQQRQPQQQNLQRPERQAHSEGYSYGGGHDYGVQGGFGLQSGRLGSADGLHAHSDLLSANGFLGGRQEADGSVSHGWGAGGQVAGVNVGYGQQGQGNFAQLQADALGGDIGAHFNPNQGANLGATAYLAQGAITAGNLGTGAADSESRLGLAAGVGAAGRLHWADSDGDGRREYGFGADVGPLTFDVKSEDPVQDLVPGARLASRLTGYEGNMTEAVGSGISRAATATRDFFSGW